MITSAQRGLARHGMQTQGHQVSQLLCDRVRACIHLIDRSASHLSLFCCVMLPQTGKT
jgi:hypothetical protein